VRLNSLKIPTLASVAMAVLVFTAPRANATPIDCATASLGSNSAEVCYTLNGDALTVTSASLNGSSSGAKLFVVGAIGTTVVDNTGLFTKSASGQGPFKGMDGVKDAGGDTSFPAGTFTLGGTATDLVFHVGGFTASNGCSFWLETAPGSSTGTLKIDAGSSCGGAPPTVPEPSTLGLLGTGLVGIAGLVRRRFTK
jgi:PEP-CTERM motif-containing protein